MTGAATRRPRNRTSLMHDLLRDWRRWTTIERTIAVVLAVALNVLLPLALELAQVTALPGQPPG